MRAGLQGRPEKAMYCRKPAFGGMGVSAESPTGGAVVSAWHSVDRAGKQAMGQNRLQQHCRKSIRALYTLGFEGGALPSGPHPSGCLLDTN
jgi:hypothetical protein